MPVVKKTSTFEKIEEIAKKTPAPLSWLIPDPYDPTSYVTPIAGLSKMQYLKALSQVGAPGAEFARKISRRLLQPINEVGLIDKIAKKWGVRLTGKDRARIWMKLPNLGPEQASLSELPALKSRLKGATADIGISSKPLRPLTAVHEPGHILEMIITPEETKGLHKTFLKMSDEVRLPLQQKIDVSLHNPKELLAEAYAQYIGGDSFKEFPPFVKHLVKKYHKLMR